MAVSKSRDVRKVLCIEDEEDIGRLLEMIVGSIGGYEPIVTGDVEEAVRHLADDPALILIDVGLPDMDGYDLCRLIRQKGCRQPIIFVSAYAGKEDVRRGYDVGGNDYVCKPFDPDDLVAKIVKWAGAPESSDLPETPDGDGERPTPPAP
jgi:DNA-binding response OmpR family regulator